MERIGVAGLGKMGAALARAWAAAGHPVTGWTRRGLTDAAAADLGIAAAPDLAGLAARSDILVTSLSDDAAVEAVLGALSTADLAGRLVVETSTVSPETIRRLAPALARAGAGVIDAPISGGPEMIAAGTAGFFVGGEVGQVERFRPLADIVANRWLHAGPLGRGLAMKIVNNMVLAGYLRSLADALTVGARSGLTMETMIGALLESPAASGFLKARSGAILGTDTSVGFGIEQAAGDQEVFLAEARRLGVEPVAVAGLHDLVLALTAAGYGAEDIAAIPRRAAEAPR